MAERYATKTGVWSDVSVWNGGATFPQAADTVHANNFTVTIDQDVTVTAVTTAAGATAVAGGGFILNDTRTLTANVIAGTTTCVTFSANSPATAAIVGNATGGASFNTQGVSVTGTGSLTITGDVTGGSNSGANGASLSGAGSVTITGNATGGSASSTNGATASNGTLTLNGNATGGTNATGNGLNVSAPGIAIVNGTITSSNTTPGAVTASSSSLLIHNGDRVSHSSGRNPISGTGLYLIHASSELTHTYRVNNAGSAGDARNLTTGGGACDYPAESDVRDGVSFNSGGSTGTLEVGSNGLKRSGFTW